MTALQSLLSANNFVNILNTIAAFRVPPFLRLRKTAQQQIKFGIECGKSTENPSATKCHLPSVWVQIAECSVFLDRF